MRKRIARLLLTGTLALVLSACGDSSSPTAENKPKEDEKVVYKELTDPRGKTLESTATGETSPKIVETKYETRDVVVADIVPTEMGYAVDPTGETDSTAGIQQALYDVFDAGGGTVYLPSGNYAISDSIYIPPYCNLQGDWQDPDEGTEYGTIISIWMEPEDTANDGAFRMGSCACAIGLTIYYPLQTLDCIMPYPYTFYVNAYEPDTRCATIRNVTMINSYKGIGTNVQRNHEQLQVDNVKGTYLSCGLFETNASEAGTCKRFKVSSKYWAEAAADCMNAEPLSRVTSYMKQYTTGMMLGDCEWNVYNEVSIESCKIGVHIVSGVRAVFAGCMYDLSIKDCTEGVVVDDIDSRWGMTIARSYIEGGIHFNADGKLKICDVEVKGGIEEFIEGSVIVDDADLSAFNVDLDKYHEKPAANLIVANLPQSIFGDAAPELQKALDAMAAQGGGIVYVPGGSYRMRTPVTVPANVELRGTAQSQTRDILSLLNGTVFLCYVGDEENSKPEDQAFITLEGENAGVNGIRITYPENGSAGAPDKETSYTIRGKANGVYVINSMITASAYGIDFSGCDNHYIGDNNTTCYKNTYRVGGTGGVIMSCLHNNTVLWRTSNVGLVNWIKESDVNEVLVLPMRKQLQHIIVEDAKDELICGTFGYGVNVCVRNINSENTLINNVGNDNHWNTSPQIYVDGGSVTGINIMRLQGYSYELVKGKVEFHCRIAVNDVGEKPVVNEK